MKCSECIKLGTVSTIRISQSQPASDIIWGRPEYYDETGVYHNHDPNILSTTYRCSNGHVWTDLSSVTPCPALNCTWFQTQCQPAMSLDEYKTNAINIVNTLVGEWRSEFITVIPGQESTYLLKENEAIAAQALLNSGTTPTPDVCPIICAESISTGSSIQDVVTLILTTAAQWKQMAAIAEGVRRGAATAIANATTIEEVTAVTISLPIITTP
jgi:hypothetical protein